MVHLKCSLNGHRLSDTVLLLLLLLCFFNKPHNLFATSYVILPQVSLQSSYEVSDVELGDISSEPFDNVSCLCASNSPFELTWLKISFVLYLTHGEPFSMFSDQWNRCWKWRYWNQVLVISIVCDSDMLACKFTN